MGNSNIKIKYLYHSGFLVETEKNLLVFDYYQGTVNNWTELTEKRIFIFSSHSHPDHFNPQIFEWQKDRPDIQYILSRDIRVPQKPNIHFLSPYEELEIENLKIMAYNSTDLGVSFFVQSEGIRLFHAGDLNWWYWLDDTPEEKAKAEKDFKDEVAKIKKEPIDIAFFPVDPRLEQNYCAGAEYFIQEINPKIFIPMHFADSPEIIEKFTDKMKGCPSQILEFTQRGQEMNFC